ncbi:hypothetical protein KAS08_05315 [Candidatus Pacearchaeota archaeon]|nr:hypothetical protein [Candidatus Pacearchaeota archaeon]
MKNIKNYVLNNLFLSKRVIIDKPGFIIHCASAFYGLKQSKKRIIYFFEDDFIDLQKNTIKDIGKKKASFLYYKIGKDFVTRHLNFSSSKSPPLFLKSYLIKRIFESFSSAGMSIGDNVSFNENNNSIVLHGKDNIISRKTKDLSLFCGIVSGVLSYFCGMNIEAKSLNNEKIIANQNIKKKYISNINKKIDLAKYNKSNLPIKNNSHNPIYPSLKDLMKFNKVRHKEGKHWFKEHLIIPMEIGIPEIYVKHYEQNDLLHLLKQSLLKSSEKRAKFIFDRKSISDDIIKLSSILCGLGWGKLIIKIDKGEISCHFISAPITSGDFLFQSLILNGYLNYILNRKYYFSSVETSTTKIPKIKIIYEMKEKGPL